MKEVYDWLAPILAPTQVIWAYRNGPRPPKEYASIFIRQLVPVGMPERTPVGDAGNRTQYSLYQLFLQLSFFGERSMAMAIDAVARLHLPNAAARACDHGLGLQRAMTIRDMPTLLNSSQYEDRVIVEIRLNATRSIVYNAGLIEKVRGEGILVYEGDTEILNVPISVDT